VDEMWGVYNPTESCIATVTTCQWRVEAVSVTAVGRLFASLFVPLSLPSSDPHNPHNDGR
jgi:hypothetical protein